MRCDINNPDRYEDSRLDFVAGGLFAREEFYYDGLG